MLLLMVLITIVVGTAALVFITLAIESKKSAENLEKAGCSYFDHR